MSVSWGDVHGSDASVLWYESNLAIVAGLNSDAPLGTKLSFVSGGTGVLLWHRSDHLSLAMVLGGAQSIGIGSGVECKLNAVIQVMDDNGPVTRKDYEMSQAPVGNSMFGRASNFLGADLLNPTSAVPSTSGPPSGFEKTYPLLKEQVNMKNRDQVAEGLFTGVKGIDILTPIGRGSSFILIGSKGSGKSSMAMDAVFGQKKSDGCTNNTAVVAAMAGAPLGEQVARTTQRSSLLWRERPWGCTNNTAVIAAMEGAPLGEQWATICTACAIGEHIRDGGGHSMVVLDTLNPLVEVWEAMLTGLGTLGAEELYQGLIKDSSGNELDMPVPVAEEELVDYEGMLVSGAVAQRRGFFSTLFMRAAKMSKAGGGGSMTLLPVIPGRPATGVSMRVDMSKYTTISEEQKAKIEAVLKAKLEAELKREAPGELKTEAVEEFISIADGQLVLEAAPSSSGAYTMNPKLSITRVGSKAYPKALGQLAPQIRLGLNQAEDARKYSAKLDTYSQRILASLNQPTGAPVPLEDLVVTLLTIQRGFADTVSPEAVPEFLAATTQRVRAEAPAALEEIASLKMLTAESEKAILAVLSAASA
eukprot:gene12133-15243_t